MQRDFLNKVVEKLKPWGREIWFAWVNGKNGAGCAGHAECAGYAGKILEIKKGHRYSLQYHQKKHETQLVIQGKLEYWISKIGTAKILQKQKSILKKGNKDFPLKRKILVSGDKIDFPPYTIHRALAKEDSIIFEVSTPELDDVIKLADDYGRTGKGNNETLDRKLAREIGRKTACKTELETERNIKRNIKRRKY